VDEITVRTASMIPHSGGGDEREMSVRLDGKEKRIDDNCPFHCPYLTPGKRQM
jgi:hypothetical protein